MATATASSIEPTISEPLSWAEIRERFPDQWVGLVEVVRNSQVALDIGHARVVCHSAAPGEVLRRLRPLRARHADAAHFFTGRIRAPFPRFL
ncbi:MAG: hypothetical protein K8W52_20295 [Deltaproteobacteria bacterium]|nr:hypothetical protein [Deltaproteobacteria bacterium]